jgi:hypothetical protein
MSRPGRRGIDPHVRARDEARDHGRRNQGPRLRVPDFLGRHQVDVVGADVLYPHDRDRGLGVQDLCRSLTRPARTGVDEIICLGDVATLGPRPNAVIEILG